MPGETKIIKNISDLKIEEGHLNIQGLDGSSIAYLAGKLWIERSSPVVIVCPDLVSTSSLFDDISYFTHSQSPGSIDIFPAPETLPYTHMIPQTDTWIDRLSVLHTVENENFPFIIAPISAILRKVPSTEMFYRHVEYVSVGQKLNRDEFITKLVSSGYNNSPLVEDEGDFASRGFIIDIWSSVTDRPCRIELDGDEVVSIRSFDPTTQRTSYSVDRLTIIPVRSVMMDGDVIKAGLRLLKSKADDIGVSVVERREYADSIKSGIYPAYTETLLPIFHPDSCFLWDYLKDDTLFFISDPAGIREHYSKFWGELTDAYREVKHVEKVVQPKDLYMNYDGWQEVLKNRLVMTANELDIISSPPLRGGDKGEGDIYPSRPPLTKGRRYETLKVNTQKAHSVEGCWIEGSSESSLNAFVDQLNSWLGRDLIVIIACHTPMQADRLLDLLRWQGLAPHASDRPFMELVSSPIHLRGVSSTHLGGVLGGIYITIGNLSEGFVWPDEKIVVLTEKEMFGKKRKRMPKTPMLPTETFTSYQDLEDGDCLVHIQHGVGRYRGMIQMQFGEMKNDFLQLEYLGGDKLYVPAYRLNQVQKYVGSSDSTPFLDKLGGTRWEKAKLKVNRAVRKMAAELLKLHATRKIKPGFAFSGRDHLMEEFEAAFPYDETPDQASSIEDIFKDMSESHPADRLICGDVGYGKTEVAMRGAFRAAMDGKQVAVLVPTTILAFQHYGSFKERFKNTPITIDLLNRFRTRTEQKNVVQNLVDGKVDIVIGTHRLLQKDVKFNDLGLLVIDEEHRFGVRQKEIIKKLKATVDVISMSATPIPRTLHTSFVGARDISVINTPPADRMSIRTYIAEFDEGLIRGSILKEIRRGGQIFFVHNRIDTIESMKDRLLRIVPEAKICVGHGQMKEHELEKVMVSFLKKDYDVLLSTTIIESGLDIPSANTMIVNRADTFGLAQLYQLRGRVGRSNVQAYAYLLIPGEDEITAIASKRLGALQKYTELGSGFQIAMHDLEIRGAGNMLGAEQSGHISAVGYEFYAELLEKEIRKLKGGKDLTEVDTEIQIPVEAYLPNTYIEDNGTRVVFYKRISALKDEAAVDEMAKELEDRFGPIPDEVKNLLKVMEIKTIASELGIDSIKMSKGVFVYKFSEATPIAASALLDFVRKNQKRITITPSSALVITEDVASSQDVFPFIRKHLEMFHKLKV